MAKIKLVEQIYNNKKNKKTYKYETVNWCCDKLKQHAKIGLYEGFPAIMFWSTENGWERINIPIDFCPFCGEHIDFVTVKTENTAEEYVKLLRERSRLNKEIKQTDSKREETFLKYQLNKINIYIEKFICFDKYDSDLLRKIKEEQFYD